MVFQKFQKRTNNSSNFAQNSSTGTKANSNFRKRGDKGGFDPNSSGQRDDTSELRIRKSIENEAIDIKYGFNRVKETKEMVGWLLNLHPTEVLDEDKRLIAAVDYYFIQDDGTRFKATLAFQPYFYILALDGFEKEVQLYLTKKYAGLLAAVEILSKEDLDLANHLVGLKRKYLKLSFLNVNDLMKVRKEIMPAIKKNKERLKENTVYSEMLKQNYLGDVNIFEEKKTTDHLENIVDIREYDVPYHVRVSIDKKIFVGVWYHISFNVSRTFEPEIQRRHDLIENPDCIVLAFDIETTKLPLKFPDSAVDQIIMISYMIDGQGFLINNREILSADVEDFEYTPKPEYEGIFTVFNEPDEKSVIQRFFDHILDIKPHIFVTYNGDFFDWPFIETRSVHHGLNMNKEIGFSEGKDGIYSSRPAIHMDAFNWVKRDSYLPVGSQNLKAVARAKLRYDPVELDPEDMCRMAAEQPQILSNYSVSDAVATYYLYMQYVHPFIFALCTIIPWEPDEVLRKGSGTLCETLLMVEAFHANIIFPNKQESVLNKLTNDGHLLDQETYVGGHVEALESGVFRADIPYRFKLEPEIFDKLISNVEKTLKHALIEEEKIPLDEVENFDEIAQEIKEKLLKLRDNPIRQELPLIYHLDVGAMYPNIILTNRLQPSAMVNEVICAACDFNKPGAKCQRSMLWTWRGEFMPATRNEFYRIQQQLEMERFPPVIPGEAMRAYHQLSKEEQASYEKKRLQDYCRKAYKKVHVTRIEERAQTVCQRENSFYVDTVRAFRDRRYEYKAMNKSAKKAVQDALAKGDAAEIKSARNVEITYDSLQLAHKCILNSFYGYVMRRGARWHSMEMAGIVCHTGSNIIKKAREIIERVGRPLELDTDGIWCMLPISFPENFVIKTKLAKKPKVTVSFPNAVLNLMVKDEFTNDQYHELIDKETLDYEVKSENSIFFEVDGPYLAMILPAAKEEGKKLKKRYAVFNQDKSLAELKGFEVKRRGELQLIKNFQSSVFDAFLKGDTLETCYQAVAKVANYWLDVLYSKALDMPDPELFDLISENRSMSRKLEDYGAQKSTSISTAKRLAEFLGDQMVKDAGLSCKFIISKKPDGAPVTERAIPLAIFQAEPSVKRHYIRRWLKDNSIIDFDIRALLDWDYYIERLGGTIQKIITIPAALQGVSNPVPRVAHPDWLHKRILEKTDVLKQRKINEVFKPTTKVYATLEEREDEDIENIDGEDEADNNDEMDIEDIGKKSRGKKAKSKKTMVSINNSRKRNKSGDDDYTKHWKEALGPSPPQDDSLVEWVQYQKKKWAYQARQRLEKTKRLRLSLSNANDDVDLQMHNFAVANRRSNVGPVTMGGFLRRNQQTLLETPWQILQVIETGHPGIFKIWALIGAELHQIKLTVPRIFYLNLREPKTVEQDHWRKCSRILPRIHPVYNLYEYCVPEDVFRTAKKGFLSDLSLPDVAGLYETQTPLDFRVFVQIGNLCTVDRQAARKIKDITDGFDLNQLIFRPMKKDFPYMDLNNLKYVYIYQHKTGTKCMIGIFFPLSNKANIFVLDTVKSNQMPNLSNVYSLSRAEKLEKDGDKYLPDANYTFDIEFETDTGKLFRQISKVLQSYKDEKRGPTFLAVQSLLTLQRWSTLVPLMAEFPMIPIHISDVDNLYSVLDWQRVGSRFMIRHYLRFLQVLETLIATSRYFQVPIGNIPADTTIFGCDIFYARHLMKQNFVLWASQTERPDFGGKEADDSRLMTEIDDQNTITINHEGCYQSVCIEIEIDGLAVNTLLQSHHVNDVEGTCATVAFDNIPQASLEEMMGNAGHATHTTYDETALCSAAFRVLRGMVNSWLREVSVNLNPLADFQLMNFYRWLRTPSAYLYDPALRKTLNNLMKKLFLQLVAEFMKLGAVVIFADFGKIVICTKKSRVADALGYVDYIINSIKTKELFHSIEFKISKCWENLLWLDAVNYGGVMAEDEESKNKKQSLSSKASNGRRKSKRKIQETPDDDGNSNSESSGEESEPEEIENDEEEEEEIKCDMNWSIVNYLPPVANCKFNFHIAVKSYIIAIYTHLSGEYENHIPGETPVRKRASQQTPRRKHNNPMMQNTIQYAKDLILGKFSQNLFTIVEKMDKRYPDPVKLVDDDEDNVNFRATLINSEKPSLQFIKIITRVLGVDANIENEVGKMRKDLLRLIEIGEFSENAEWVEPCASIILPEVICRICNQCRDIDLTKDTNVKVENDLPVWFCPACDGCYETANIELALIDSINRKSMTLVLQDLQCTKCQKIQNLNVRQRCSCSGELSTLIDGKINICRLRAYKGLAIHFGMPLLLQNVEWILKMN